MNALPSYVVEALPIFERVLAVGKGQKQNHVLQTALTHKECTKAIVEFAHNVLFNDAVRIDASLRRRLREHKADYEKLASRSVDLAAKRRLILKRGRLFVPVLLKTIVPYLKDG